MYAGHQIAITIESTGINIYHSNSHIVLILSASQYVISFHSDILRLAPRPRTLLQAATYLSRKSSLYTDFDAIISASPSSLEAIGSLH
jgi:hypothetical protein